MNWLNCIGWDLRLPGVSIFTLCYLCVCSFQSSKWRRKKRNCIIYDFCRVRRFSTCGSTPPSVICPLPPTTPTNGRSGGRILIRWGASERGGAAVIVGSLRGEQSPDAPAPAQDFLLFTTRHRRVLIASFIGPSGALHNTRERAWMSVRLKRTTGLLFFYHHCLSAVLYYPFNLIA